MHDLIGICGLIGSGKSAVARQVADAGFCVIHADDEAHVLYAKNQDVRAQMAQAFGSEVLTETGVDRVRLGNLVFADSGELAKLEAIIHPALARHLQERLNQELSLHTVFLEAALLPKWPDLLARCDQVWQVESSEALRLARIMERGLSEEAATQRIRKQDSFPPIVHKNFIQICNEGSLSGLQSQIARLLRSGRFWNQDLANKCR
jgi:dephospho-CoA kinase